MHLIINFERLFNNPFLYTLEEFVPDYETNGLMIYQLIRDDEERKNNNKYLPLMRINNMSLIKDCTYNVNTMMVTIDIQ